MGGQSVGGVESVAIALAEALRVAAMAGDRETMAVIAGRLADLAGVLAGRERQAG